MQGWDEFDWDEENENHIAKHQVDRYEVEEAVTDPAALVNRVGRDRFGNTRYIYIGKTVDGRLLYVVVDRKGLGHFRVGSAREARFKEKRAYRVLNRRRNR